MRWWPLLCTACVGGEGQPPARTGTTAPDVEELRALVEGTGRTATVADKAVRTACGTGDQRVAVTVQTFADANVVYLATRGLERLSTTADERGVVLVLTQIATLNYATLEGKLQLNPMTGEIILSTELETDDGLGTVTFSRGLDTLCETAATVRPKLRDAMVNGLL